MKIQREIVDGKTVYAWSVGDKGGYCATVADAANDAGIMQGKPIANLERAEMDGMRQYQSVIGINGNEPRGASDSSPFSDWAVDDAGAIIESFSSMEDQGYVVQSVEITYPVSIIRAATPKHLEE